MAKSSFDVNKETVRCVFSPKTLRLLLKAYTAYVQGISPGVVLAMVCKH